jgi:uncharacterized protein (DUF4415 family)/uncharacterized DUF497 family protein
MEFEWNSGKAASNLAKHRVSFDVVFELDWEICPIIADARFDYGEARYIAYARSEAGARYVVAFTLRGGTYGSSASGISGVRSIGSMATKRTYGVPDEDTPELTKESLATARTLNEILAERGLPLIGRPKSAVTKQPVNLRLDPEIIAHFKADGDGWQTRINAVLSKHVRASRSASARKKSGSHTSKSVAIRSAPARKKA